MANVHKIGDKTGEQLARKMVKITSSRSWKKGTKSILTVGGKPVAEMKPKPTPRQPGNGIVSFKGKSNVKYKFEQLYVLTKYEEARKVPGDAKGHLPRKQIIEGNKKAMQKGKPHNMIAQYSGTTKQRKEANQKITKISQQKKKPGIGSKSGRGGSGSGASKRGGSGRGSGSASGRAGGSRSGAGSGRGSGSGRGKGGGGRKLTNAFAQEQETCIEYSSSIAVNVEHSFGFFTS